MTKIDVSSAARQRVSRLEQPGGSEEIREGFELRLREHSESSEGVSAAATGNFKGDDREPPPSVVSEVLRHRVEQLSSELDNDSKKPRVFRIADLTRGLVR
jgi:hypothetical protein